MHDKQVLDETQIRAALSGELAQWSLRDTHLERRFETGGWRTSLMVANAIGLLAEQAWHHPDLIVTFPAVVVRVQSHDVGGITGRDLELARRIEALVLWRPEPGASALSGLPAGEPSLRLPS
ncbi:MAG: 4a-hydroxytetrahydrobiopterin dehydratase [Burkholderiaceae bacterium]